MSDAPDQSPSDTGASQPNVEILCASCDYALSGLQQSLRCPECGYDNRKSPPSMMLTNRSKAYVERLTQGALLVGTGGVIGIVTGLAGVTMFNFWSYAFQSLGLLICLGGIWIGTERDPGLPEHLSGRVLRRNARALVGILAGIEVLFLVGHFASARLAMLAMGVLWTATALIAAPICTDYVSWIAQRARWMGCRSTLAVLSACAAVLVIVRFIPLLSVAYFVIIAVYGFVVHAELRKTVVFMRERMRVTPGE